MNSLNYYKVKFKGILFKGGNYGHLGKYNKKIDVKKIINYSESIL